MTKLSHQNPKGTYIVFASMGRSKGGRVTLSGAQKVKLYYNLRQQQFKAPTVDKKEFLTHRRHRCYEFIYR